MYGKYRHSVDPKGRLFVPAKLREELGSVFYVTIGLDRCLSVYPEQGWQEILDRAQAMPMSQVRKLRYFFANAAKCEPDKQGRFLIPTELRQYASLGQDVLFLGQGAYSEIWDATTYEAEELDVLSPEYMRQTLEEMGF